MVMDNGFDITKTLEYSPGKVCHEVTFYNKLGCPIHVRFTKYDVTVVGDYGGWIFKGNIVNCFNFFKGNHTNPGYWEEKLEAAPKFHYDRTIDGDKLRKALLEEYPDVIKEEDLEHLESDRDTIESWYDTVYDFNNSKDWDLEMEDLYGTMQTCIVEDQLYLRVCELVQFVANYLAEQGVTGDC